MTMRVYFKPCVLTTFIVVSIADSGLQDFSLLSIQEENATEFDEMIEHFASVVTQDVRFQEAQESLPIIITRVSADHNPTDLY